MSYNIKASGAKRKPSTHLLIWVDTVTAKPKGAGRRQRVRSRGVRAWRVQDLDDMVRITAPIDIDGALDLANACEMAREKTGRLTVWLVRGWTDFVLCGITELLEQGKVKWQWCSLDGARCSMVGTLNGRGTDVTSLSAFSGTPWDSWRADALKVVAEIGLKDMAQDVGEDEMCAIGTLSLILSGARAVNAGPQKLSASAQARSMWRTWLSPVLICDDKTSGAVRKNASDSKAGYVVPLADQIPSGRAADRHACYGMMREQYYSGHVGGCVHVYDMRAAYAVGLAMARLPVAYECVRRNVTVDALCALDERRVCTALVRIESPELPYPARVGTKAVSAIGSYWTWLSCADLSESLRCGHVVACDTVHTWYYSGWPQETLTRFLGSLSTGESADGWRMKRYFRSLYSALVGGWAQWGREWHDATGPAAPRDWCQWTMSNPDNGDTTYWRSVAGRMQIREDGDTHRYAAPIMYSAVLSQVRRNMRQLMGVLPTGSVLAAVSDSIWITDAADEIVMRSSADPGEHAALCAHKATYDDAWLDGHGGAVLLSDGRYYSSSPGVPGNVPLGDDGRAHWQHVSPWSDIAGPDRARGVPIGTASHDGLRLMRANAHTLRSTCPYRVMEGAIMREELLLPVKYPGGI